MTVALRKERLESAGVIVKELRKAWKDWPDEKHFSTVLEIVEV